MIKNLSPGDLARRAEIARERGFLEYSLRLYQQVTERQPFNYAHWLRIAGVSASLELDSAVSEALERASSLAQEPSGLIAVAHQAEELGELMFATEHLLRARSLDPENPRLRIDILRLLLRQGDFEQARWELRRGETTCEQLEPIRERLNEYSNGQFAAEFGERDLFYVECGAVCLSQASPNTVRLDFPTVAAALQRLVALKLEISCVVPAHWGAMPLALALANIADVPLNVNCLRDANRPSLVLYSEFPLHESETVVRGDADIGFCLGSAPGWRRHLPLDFPHFVGFMEPERDLWDQVLECPKDQRGVIASELATRILRAFKSGTESIDVSGALNWCLQRHSWLSYLGQLESSP